MSCNRPPKPCYSQPLGARRFPSSRCVHRYSCVTDRRGHQPRNHLAVLSRHFDPQASSSSWYLAPRAAHSTSRQEDCTQKVRAVGAVFCGWHCTLGGLRSDRSDESHMTGNRPAESVGITEVASEAADYIARFYEANRVNYSTAWS